MKTVYDQIQDVIEESDDFAGPYIAIDDENVLCLDGYFSLSDLEKLVNILKTQL